MRRRVFIPTAFILVGFFSLAGWIFLLGHNATNDVAGGVHGGLIRFHVLANSDNDDDQQLKLKVRDAVIAYLDPYMEQSTDVNQARQIVQAQQQKLAEVAKKTITANGYDYPVDVQIGNFEFPIKSYGKLVLPAGNYEAVRILIGKAEGRNWWCVLFPPLCFIDIANATAAPAVHPDSGEKSSEEDSNKIHYKWKIAELLYR